MSVKVPDVKIPKLSNKAFAQTMYNLGNYDNSKIYKRTMSGKDIYGHNFKPYGKATLKRKEALQRSTGTSVTLMASGKMLRGLKLSTRGTKYIITLTDHAYIGQLHQEGIGVPKREWFGSDNEMRENHKKELMETYRKEMRK